MKHKHHIIPKHMGGSDDPSNLIELSIEEHAEAHRLLYEQYGKLQDKLAWLGLSKMISSADIIAELLRAPRSEKTKKKMSDARKGKSNYWSVGNQYAKVLKGRKRPDSTKKKIADSKTGKKRPDLIGNNFAFALKGRKKTDKHQQAINAALNATDVKEKISTTWANKPMVKCPYCGVEGKEGHNMNRFHFNNCKMRD